MGQVIKERLKKLKDDIPTLFLCLRDGKTPLIAKVLAALTVAYALSPIDLIPDFIPVLGFLDDALILPGLVILTAKLIPKEVWNKNREKAKDLWKDGKPKHWYYAIPIVIIWALLIWWIVSMIKC